MKQTSGELLAQGFAKIIVESWLKLDQINNQYRLSLQRQRVNKVLLPRISSGYEEMEQQALFNQNNFYYQEFDIDNSSQQTKRYVFQYYLSEQKDRIQRENPQLSINQIRIKAAYSFKNLSPSQKIHYLKLYLKENKYKNRITTKENHKNGQIPNQPFQNYMQTTFNPFSSSEGIPIIPSLFDNIDNNYWKREKQAINKEINFFDQALRDKISQQNHSTIKKPANAYQSNENRQKNDTNKNVNQNNDKKNEEWKEKAQFQTLKSLFKRLQSNN